jgi:hypothetical protein
MNVIHNINNESLPSESSTSMKINLAKTVKFRLNDHPPVHEGVGGGVCLFGGFHGVMKLFLFVVFPPCLVLCRCMGLIICSCVYE